MPLATKQSNSQLPFLKDKIKCQCCLNEDTDTFIPKFEKNNLTVVECQKCSFTFIPWHYRKDISYHDYKNEEVLKQIRAGNDWLKVQRHLLRFKTIQPFIKKGKLFDLGVGWGHFLLAAKQLGYDVYGIEISKYPYIYAKEDLKLPVDHLDFFEMKPQKFDIITMWDVLEHIDEADSFIAKTASMLNKGGFLVLQVPQIDSFVAKRKKENWNMMGLDHVNYFGRKTIKLFLERHGFEVVKIESSIEIKLFLMYTILPWIKKIKGKGKKKESISISSSERQEYYNKTADKPMWMLKAMIVIHNLGYNLLSKLNIGEEMIVIARKK